MTMTTTSPAAWVHDLLDAVGAEPKQAKTRQCPAHRDPTPSMSVSVGREGQALLHCHAGCPTEAILAALCLSFRQLYEPPPGSAREHVATWKVKIPFPPVVHVGGSPRQRGFRLEVVHDYPDHALERWRHPQTGAKDLVWMTRRNGILTPGLFGTPLGELPLYREREVRMAVAAEENIYVVESESSVDALRHHGLYATTWAGGAATPNLARLQRVLQGANVVLVPDNDVPGIKCARRIFHVLKPVVAALSVILPPEGQDARDLLDEDGLDALTEGI